jgi:flagellar hook-basal body complex protein FliE
VIPPISAITGGIGPLGPAEWSIGGLGPAGGAGASAVQAAGPTVAATAAQATQAVAPTGSASFGSVLTNAISSLDQTQATAASASQGLATGTLSDPTQAVTAVENASLSMDFASQITNKVVSDANTIFQTQM